MSDDVHPENYEDVTIYDLDEADEEKLLLAPQRVHVHLGQQGRVAGRGHHVVHLA